MIVFSSVRNSIFPDVIGLAKCPNHAISQNPNIVGSAGQFLVCAESASAARDMAWRCVRARAVATTMAGFGGDGVI